MFEKIVLRRSNSGPAISIGEIAEALLFYQNVHIVFDLASLIELVKKLGCEKLLLLIKRRGVTTVFCEETLGTHTEHTSPFPTHKFVGIVFAGNQEIGQLHTLQAKLTVLIERHGLSKKEARNFVRRFLEKTPSKKLLSDYFIEGGITKVANADLFDNDFIKEAIGRIISDITGESRLPHDFKFEILNPGERFHVHTNADFAKINALARKKNSASGEISPASLMTDILTAQSDMILASHYGGEFYTSNLTSEIICLKHSRLLRRLNLETKERKEFVEIVFHEGRSVKETLNSGERSFEDFLKLLDTAEKFKEWLNTVNPDEKLVKEYFSEISNQGWISSLPIKALRYLLGTAVSADPHIGATVGTAVSFVDTFWLEKLLGGWKPSHFVNKDLKRFLIQS